MNFIIIILIYIDNQPNALKQEKTAIPNLKIKLNLSAYTVKFIRCLFEEMPSEQSVRERSQRR